jgi:2-C-methyl-D-erythritol 4-phosphate cytidylyltransferase
MLLGRPVLSHTLAAFDECLAVDEIVVVVHPDRVDEYRREAVDPIGSAKVTAVVGGGATRQESVAAGLAAVPADASVVIVHDGARPLVAPALITRALAALEAEPGLAGVVVGHPSYDTMKIVGSDGLVTDTPDRAALWAAQTPQVFRADVLRNAYAAAAAGGYGGTDDASLVERTGGAVRMVTGPRNNIKITVSEDVLLAERFLEARAKGESDG